MIRKALAVVLVLFCVSAALYAWRASGSTNRNQRAAAAPMTSTPVTATSGAAAKVGLAVGNRAPDFALPTPGGAKILLSSLRGKPVLLNFWASWCPPCKQEMPDIQQYWTEHQGQVEILAVNLTAQERSISTVQRFLTDRGLTFPVVLDQNGDVALRFGVVSIPSSYFIDKDGIIWVSARGALDAKHLAAGFKLAGGQ